LLLKLPLQLANTISWYLSKGDCTVDISLEDFRRHFEILSDEALMETNRDDLVETARLCFDEEVSRRGLKSAAGTAEAEQLPAAEPVNPEDELVSIATYSVADEANFARGLLQSAGIPLHLANEHVALGGFQMRLMVPAAYEEQALEILETEISDEELAAQAEAAGTFEDEEETSDEPE
jgi:hypothetical protein